MSVFLRWGILGILGVAALLYVYNATKHIAEARAAKTQTPAAQAMPSVTEPEPARPAVEAEHRPPPPQMPATPAHCENELVVAKRAIEMKKAGEPLDRVLRIQEVAWQEPPARRARLETVATRWFGYDGDFNPEA